MASSASGTREYEIDTASFSSGGGDGRAELAVFEETLEALKVQYEKFFTGIVQLPPEKLHAQVKLSLRKLRKLPFKSTSLAYRHRSLETRYNSLNTYWMRVLRERERGTYFKDVFKASMRERHAVEDAFDLTEQGQAEHNLKELFESFCQEVNRATGKTTRLAYEQFRNTVVDRAKMLQEQKNSSRAVSFQVVVSGGQVSLQARIKEE